MPPSLLASQLDTLEPPEEDEDALTLNASEAPGQLAGADRGVAEGQGGARRLS